MKLFWSAIWILMLVACRHRLPMDLQPLEPLAKVPTDSVVLAAIQSAHPCPVSVPPGWVATDSSLGSGSRCSLVAASRAAVQAFAGDTEVARVLRADLEREPLCTRLSTDAYRNLTTGAVELAQWTVEFVFPAPPTVVVEISRLTGAPHVLLGLEEGHLSRTRICMLFRQLAADRRPPHER